MRCTAGHDPDSSVNPSGARGEQHSRLVLHPPAQGILFSRKIARG
jgi:hypothetical protein